MIPAMSMAGEGRAARPHSTVEVIPDRAGVKAGCTATGSENGLYRGLFLSRMFACSVCVD
jgi:hypothetical protein